MSGFSVGDRVMVERFESPYSCNLNGFYGHVASLWRGLVLVDIKGCLRGAPDEKEREHLVEDPDPFPFLEQELVHAD